MDNISSHVPPGFRFYPTDEELVDYYLRRKVNSRRIDLDVIKEVDLYKIEPWDLQEICRMGDEEQNEWYFFSHKDKKYPTGTRTNRATAAGFWKATGRDKAIYSKRDLIGMRKTLVFYKGRAPNGLKSDWIMHEYRLETDENGPPQEEGWVVCRVFKKKPTTMSRMNMSEHESCWYEDQVAFAHDFGSPKQVISQSSNPHNYPPDTHKEELLNYQHHLIPFRIPQEQHLIHLPNFLDSSKVLLPSPHSCNNALIPYGLDINQASTTMSEFHDNNNHQNTADLDVNLIGRNNIDDAKLDDQVTDWRVLDKFVASQLSQEVGSDKESNANCSSSIAPPAMSGTDTTPLSEHASKKEELALPDNTSASTTSSSPIEVWK